MSAAVEASSFGNRRCGGVTWTLRQGNGEAWEVNCSCGFAVFDLSTREAARDTAAWHRGDASTPLDAVAAPLESQYPESEEPSDER